MREYKRYEDYKDSGVEWIGTIPNEWDVERFRTLTKNIQNGKWGEEAQNNSDDIYCVRVADYNREKNIVEDQEFTIRNLDKSSREELLLEKDDLLLEKSGGGDKQPVGFVAQYKSEKPAIYANFMAKIEPRKEYIKTDYLKYVNVSVYQKREILKVINQTTGIQNLDTKRYLEIECPLPSKSEQQKIASFLDQKTTEIDKIINKKETLIDKLEKYKKSVITEAVTKGKLGDNYIDESGELVDEIEMTDSRVKWIGEVPKYFYETKLKYNIKTTKGYAFKASRFKDAGIPIIKATHIKNKTIIETNDYISPEHLKEYKSVKLYKDDIIMSTVGSNPDVLESAVGQLAMVPEKYDGALLNQNTVIFRIPKNQDISKKFLFYYLTSNKFRKFLDLYAHGTANQSSLTLREVLNFPLALPKKEIQEFIIDLIDNKILYINKLINKTKQSIEKYKEYKKSLIFEAVTGKLDLRDYELEGGEELAEHNNSSEIERECISAVD